MQAKEPTTPPTPTTPNGEGNNGGNGNVTTGDMTTWGMTAVVMLLAVGAVVVVIKKKKRNKIRDKLTKKAQIHLGLCLFASLHIKNGKIYAKRMRNMV